MKQKLSLILALLAVTGAVVSCGETAQEPVTGSETVTPPTETQPVETETQRPSHKVPVDSLNFGGEEFNMYAVEWQGYKYYFFAEEENGDVMNDAIYRRKRSVEEALNVSIVSEMCDGYIDVIVTDVKKAVSSDVDCYDQVFLHCISGISSLASGGYLYNLDELPHVDMTAPWWNRIQMDALRLGENTYYAVNDFMIPCPYVVFFNKEMVQNYDMKNPYALVKDGKWTLDVFTKMSRDVLKDLNGDGKFTDVDQYGISANEISKYISFVTGCGQYITEKDSDEKITLAINTPKMQNLIEIFCELEKDNIIYLPAGTEFDDIDPNMNSGRILFYLNSIAAAEQMREYTVDFGFLPYPKYDEAQKDYISLDWGGLTAVPTTVKNPEMVGAVMELLAYESKNEVIPTYYDTILQGKLARDDDAIEMMDLLFDTITYEIGGNYFGFDAGFTDLFYALPRVAIEGKNSDFASFYSKNEAAANKDIENFYKGLDTVENG